MNSQVPPCSWQELRSAPGKADATLRAMPEWLGRGLRVSPGAIGDSGAAQVVVPPAPTGGATATGREGDTNVAQLVHGPNVSGGPPRCARTRHEYVVS